MSASRLRIEWVSWQPTPYNNYLWRAIAAEPDVDLQLHFISRVVVSHPWEVGEDLGFRARYFQRTLGLDFPLLWRALRDRRSVFLIAGWHDPTMQVATTVRGLSGAPLAVWTDTPDASARPATVREWMRAAWLRWVFRRATHVFGTGAPALDVLDRMGCPREKTINLPFFVPLPPSRPLSVAGGRVVFVSSGRLANALKGHDLAIEALARARDATGVDVFEYVIAGTGADEEDLRRRVERLGLQAQVQFTGWLNPPELASLFARSHVLLHPSRYDPFPVAVLEAMAAGLVVMGSDVCGSIRERVRHGVNGFVHRTGDVCDLTRQLIPVLREPGMLTAMGQAARQTAEQWPVERGVAIVTSALRNV